MTAKEFVWWQRSMEKSQCYERNCEFMKDYIVRATAAKGQVRAFAATTGILVEEARWRRRRWDVF